MLRLRAPNSLPPGLLVNSQFRQHFIAGIALAAFACSTSVFTGLLAHSCCAAGTSLPSIAPAAFACSASVFTRSAAMLAMCSVAALRQLGLGGVTAP